MKKANSKLSLFEKIWYTLCAGFGLWGLTYSVLGTIAGTLRPDAGLAKADATIASLFGLGYLGWGLILLGIGCVLAVLVLLLTSKKSDREVEKQQRRAARLGKTTVIDAEVTPAKDNNN